MSFSPTLIRPGATDTLVDAGFGPFEQEQLQRILSNWRMTPATFAMKLSRGAWIPSPHLLYIALRIAKAVKKGNARIILSMPPRHGKSRLVSTFTPAWLLEYIGKISIILASYGAELAEGFHTDCRNILVDPMNRDLLRVKPGEVWRAGELTTNLGGYFYAVGLGGAITGRGADVLLIDDYIKEVKEALSPTYREYVWNWYVTTAYTRLEPNGSIIIIATRWHSDDLIGRVLQEDRDGWEYIELPAQSLGADKDILQRPLGQPLFPERYTAEKLLEVKKTLGTIWYEALYQQRPVDETMRITDTSWLKYWPKSQLLPTYMSLCRIWDLAATEDGGDWLTGALCGYDESTENFLLLDYVHEQLGPGQVEEMVYRTAINDGEEVTIGIEQEPGASGKILIEHYKTTVLKDFMVKPIATGNKKKLMRAQPFLAACEDGHVYLYEAAWNKTFRDEFETFPGASRATHDDMVDTAAEGYTELTGKKPLRITWGRGTDAQQLVPVGRQDLAEAKAVKLRRSGTKKSRSLPNPSSPYVSTGTRTGGATWGRKSLTSSNIIQPSKPKGVLW